MFKLMLVDPNMGFYYAAKEYFDGLPHVEYVNGFFEDVSAFDCMVSPANSFGLMDGGVDAAITNFFGVQLMQRVQKHIIEHYRGEQSVGTSFIIETNHPKHPFLAHTPTMRVPMVIAHTDNVYRAMWAMLLAVHHHNEMADKKIEIIVCPGLGTGVGQVPYKQAARQMALAYKNFLTPPQAIHWTYATERQVEIRYGGDMGLTIPPEIN